MNKEVLNTGVQYFIKNNLNTDISSLLLKGIHFKGVSDLEIATQIEAKKKCESKLPTWFSADGIYYPNKLNIEQTSSETTAQYKAGLINGKTLVDLTGGFGVDAYFFAKNFNEVTHCEINQELSKIVTHNYKKLGVKNIKTYPENGLDFLKRTNQKFDWIYMDPSRRNDVKAKVFKLADCLPNAPENLSLLLQFSNNILIKTSPLLDFSIGINELHYVKEIHVVALNNDVKELLWVLNKDYQGDIHIKTINLKKDENEVFDFILSEEKETKTTVTDLEAFLYEPNSAILKSGGFNILAKKLNVGKLHQHSHLYTSERLINFPGRSFQIEEILPYNKKQLKKKLKGLKANVSTRNFPESVDQLKKHFQIKDGGDLYIFFSTNAKNEKIVIICRKASHLKIGH